MTTARFDHFEPILRRSGASAVRHPDTLIAREATYEVFYIPFEHVNRRARLVIVGITPGMNQLEMAYAEAQRLLKPYLARLDLGKGQIGGVTQRAKVASDRDNQLAKISFGQEVAKGTCSLARIALKASGFKIRRTIVAAFTDRRYMIERCCEARNLIPAVATPAA